MLDDRGPAMISGKSRNTEHGTRFLLDALEPPAIQHPASSIQHLLPSVPLRLINFAESSKVKQRKKNKRWLDWKFFFPGLTAMHWLSILPLQSGELVCPKNNLSYAEVEGPNARAKNQRAKTKRHGPTPTNNR